MLRKNSYIAISTHAPLTVLEGCFCVEINRHDKSLATFPTETSFGMIPFQLLPDLNHWWPLSGISTDSSLFLGASQSQKSILKCSCINQSINFWAFPCFVHWNTVNSWSVQPPCYWFGHAIIFFLMFAFDFVWFSVDTFPAAWWKDFQVSDLCCDTFPLCHTTTRGMHPNIYEGFRTSGPSAAWTSKTTPKFFLVTFLPKFPIMDFLDTPLKFNMEPENSGINKKNILFPVAFFPVPC